MITSRCGLLLSVFIAFTLPLGAQVPDSQSQPAQPAPAPAAAPASSSSAAKPKANSGEPGKPSFLGKDVPVYDPGTDVVTWDSQRWNVNNNRVFQARFEKYLNAPEETNKDATDYRTIIGTILYKLAPQNLTDKSLMEAFRLLPKASGYDIDARLCDSLADAVYSAWSSQRASQQLADATDAMEAERKRLEWNLQIAVQDTDISGAPGGGSSGGKKKGGGGSSAASGEWSKNEDAYRAAKVQPYAQRLLELNAQMKANMAKKELNKLQTKIEFQAFMLQLFMQRRFEHVLMATRFYRAVFSDGDTKLQVGKDAKDLFAKSVGMPPTVSTLDSMANEAIRDVRESVQAYDFLVKNHELDSATKRLGEAFSIGEYIPEIRALPREKKRLALTYSQKGNKLISALEAHDFAVAEKLVSDMKAMATDFDDSKASTAISTGKTVASFHLMKAKNALEKGDQATFEAELAEATQMWPGNPQLAEFATRAITESGKLNKSLEEFDRLLREKNYRRIVGDQVMMAMVGASGERKGQLEMIISTMKRVEGAIEKSKALTSHGDNAGAWESIEKEFKEFPADTELTQLRAELTTNAADFVHTIRTAEEMEQKDQVGSSLAWYLKAQKIYPGSEFAQDGVTRLVKKVLPEDTET